MWVVEGRSTVGAMSVVAPTEQAALALHYALGDDPRYDAWTFFTHPMDGWDD